MINRHGVILLLAKETRKCVRQCVNATWCEPLQHPESYGFECRSSKRTMIFVDRLVTDGEVRFRVIVPRKGKLLVAMKNLTSIRRTVVCLAM
jgi:hypothetical protein